MADVQSIAIVRSMGGLVFDAVFEEVHDHELEVTENPVETGVLVADHAYKKPIRLTITAGVSNAGAGRVGDQFGNSASRATAAFEALLDLQKSREPFDVQTGLGLYGNMICTGIRTAQDKDTSGALIFTAELREVIIVKTATVRYPPRKDAKTKQQGDKKKEKGEQQGKPVDGDKKAEKKSIAKTLKDGGSTYKDKGK